MDKRIRSWPSAVYGTLEHFDTTRWAKMNRRCQENAEKRKYYFEKGIKVEISRSEFTNFVKANAEKIKQIYQSGLIPSIDRIDSNKSYKLGNIQIVSMNENISRKATKRKRSAPLWAQNIETNEVILLIDGRFGEESKKLGLDPYRILQSLKNYKNRCIHKGYYFIKAPIIDANNSRL